jgi:hypothetical protein
MCWNIGHLLVGSVVFEMKIVDEAPGRGRGGASVMGLICDFLDHVPNGKVHPVYSSTGKWEPDPASGISGCRICYHMRLCARCGKHIPIDAENAAEKAKKTAEIAAVMNSGRAHLGLAPISWDT